MEIIFILLLTDLSIFCVQFNFKEVILDVIKLLTIVKSLFSLN